jgi:anhydro-N-acetylmuramic acid kinase
MASSQAELYIGLMSGTSMVGIDAVLVDFSDPQPKQLASHTQAWPTSLQQALIKARDIPDDELDSLTSLDLETAEVFAEASLNLLKKTNYQAKDIIAIGNHGQTIRHRPNIKNPFSLQIGNAKKLAERTKINVISDFRTADIKAGGQGAPLVPAFHQAIFQNKTKNRVIVNIGGIANITVLAKDITQDIIGFDCGPGNTLMDAWVTKQKQQSYDVDGKLAAEGKTNVQVLATLLMDDYFQLPAPKSTGFEYFNLDWLENNTYNNKNSNEISPADMQSILCDLTATSIIRAINQYAKNTDEIYICGGGAHNKELMHRLQNLTKSSVTTTEILGVHPNWVEAMAFAWLAYQHNNDLTGNLPSVTGANKAIKLGVRTFA